MVVDVAAVAEGVLGTEGRCEGAAHGKDVTPCVIGVSNNGIPVGTVHQSDYVTLQVLDVVIVLGGGRPFRTVGYLNGIATTAGQPRNDRVLRGCGRGIGNGRVKTLPYGARDKRTVPLSRVMYIKVLNLVHNQNRRRYTKFHRH